MNTTQRPLLTAAAVMLAMSSVTLAGVIELEWDAVPEAFGYRVYYGSASESYSASVDAGSATRATVSGLDDCIEYFVAVKAYNSAGESDQYSSEVSGWPRPEIDSFDPSAAQQGDVFTLNIWGANFDANATVSWLADDVPTDALGVPLVRFDSVRVMSCNLIQAVVSIESPVRGQRAMRVGDLPVAFEVQNPDRVFGAASRIMNIRFNSSRADINRSDQSTRDRVDGRDLSWLAYAYGTTDGGVRFNPDADLDGDGLIDGDDLAMLAPRFGKCWDGTTWGTNDCP